MALISQTLAYARAFLMVLASDHISGAGGATVTGSVGKSAGPWASFSGAVTELGGGWYIYTTSTAETDTLGDLRFACTAASCDPTDFADQVVAFNPHNNVNLGLGALPGSPSGSSGGLLALNAAGGLTISGGVTFTNASGTAFLCTSTGGNGKGISATGQGSGQGILATGGATNTAGLQGSGGGSGAGLYGIGGSSSGAGIRGDGLAAGPGMSVIGGTSNVGFYAAGGGSGQSGMLLAGNGAGAGLNAGGGVGGHGITATGNSGGAGMNLAGGTTGAGLLATGGATGHGISGVGGTTIGVGIRAVGTSNSSGMTILAAGTAADLTAVLTATNAATELCHRIADRILRRQYTNLRTSSDGETAVRWSLMGAIARLVNRTDFQTQPATIYHEDGSTSFFTETMTTASTADAVVQLT